MIILKSDVPGFEGECSPVWLNTNQVCNRIDQGVTGFFKNIKRFLGISYKSGEEFHGIIKNDCVKST